jgi:hypothetical protein
LTDFSKNTKISDFMKIFPLGRELFHPAGKTDMTKLTVAFRKFANAPKNRWLLLKPNLNFKVQCPVKVSHHRPR